MGWFRRRAQEDRELLFKTLNAIMEASAAQSRAAEAQARALEAHMELFKPSPAIEPGWVNRDEEEYMAEMERKGFPRHGTDEAKLRWVQENSGGDFEELYELRKVNE